MDISWIIVALIGVICLTVWIKKFRPQRTPRTTATPPTPAARRPQGSKMDKFCKFLGLIWKGLSSWKTLAAIVIAIYVYDKWQEKEIRREIAETVSVEAIPQGVDLRRFTVHPGETHREIMPIYPFKTDISWNRDVLIRGHTGEFELFRAVGNTNSLEAFPEWLEFTPANTNSVKIELLIKRR